jgi:ABC-type Fe3+/spermidine/putrescine transport system ATPase subunit
VELQRRLGTTSLYVTHDQSEAMLMSDRIILMQDGLMVQSGTPRDLYYRPINRFAAEFIGNANILEAEIVKRDGNNAQVRLPGGAVLEGQFCWPEHRRDDGTTLAVIRAESIDTGPAAANTLKATVRSVSFVGPSVSCMLDLGGFSLRAELSARRPPAVGQTIDIHIDSEAVGFIAGH